MVATGITGTGLEMDSVEVIDLDDPDLFCRLDNFPTKQAGAVGEYIDVSSMVCGICNTFYALFPFSRAIPPFAAPTRSVMPTSRTPTRGVPQGST